MIDLNEDLAGAIILQAVRDWRRAVRKLKKWPWDQQAVKMKEECETFFLSSWFADLTDVSGSYLLRRLKEEENINDE